MAIVNRYNFLRWSDSLTIESATADFATEDFDADDFTLSATVTNIVEDYGDFPRPYLLDRERCGFTPTLVQNDSFAFYINTADGMDLGSFSDIRMRFITAHGDTVLDDVGPLQKDDVYGANYNLFSTFTVPSLPVGLLRLQIYRVSDGTVLLTSNQLLFRNDSQVRYQTLLVRFRNDRLMYNFRYPNVPGFYQQFRLSINVLERLYESDRQTYTAVTTGKTRALESYDRRYYRFETYYFDSPAHEACAVMVGHSDVQFNGINLLSKTPYKEPSDNLMSIGKGEFEMYDVDYASVNRCGVAPSFMLGTGLPGEVLGTGVPDEVLGIGG